MFGYLHYFTDPPKGFQCIRDESRSVEIDLEQIKMKRKPEG